jgi:hypothetical protein
MAVALEHLQAADGQVRFEDVQRLSPRRHEHINLHGGYYSPPTRHHPDSNSATSETPSTLSLQPEPHQPWDFMGPSAKYGSSP